MIESFSILPDLPKSCAFCRKCGWTLYNSVEGIYRCFDEVNQRNSKGKRIPNINTIPKWCPCGFHKIEKINRSFV